MEKDPHRFNHMVLYMYLFVNDYQKDYRSGTDKKLKVLKVRYFDCQIQQGRVLKHL